MEQIISYVTYPQQEDVKVYFCFLNSLSGAPCENYSQGWSSFRDNYLKNIGTSYRGKTIYKDEKKLYEAFKTRFSTFFKGHSFTCWNSVVSYIEGNPHYEREKFFF